MVSRRQIHIFTSKWLGRRGGGLSKILNCYYHYKKDKKDGIVKRACTTTSKLNTVRERRTHTKICPPRELPLFYTPYLVYRQAHVTFVINVPMLCAARVKTKDMTGDRKHWKKKTRRKDEVIGCHRTTATTAVYDQKWITNVSFLFQSSESKPLLSAFPFQRSRTERRAGYTLKRPVN